MSGKSQSKATGPKKAPSVSYQCTACSKPITTTYEANLHPLIDCLICRSCYTTYGSGDFGSVWEDGVDDQGDDNYCRWCCDGGELFGCMNDGRADEDRCHYSFCKDCITRNAPDDEILKLDGLEEEEASKIKWFCYACDKSKLSRLIEEAKAAMKDLNERERKKNLADLSSNPNPTKKRKKESGAGKTQASAPIPTPEPRQTNPEPKSTNSEPKPTNPEPKPTNPDQGNLAETVFTPLKETTKDTSSKAKATPKPPISRLSDDPLKLIPVGKGMTTPTNGKSQFKSNVPYKAMPLSKQLKPNNDQPKSTTKAPLKLNESSKSSETPQTATPSKGASLRNTELKMRLEVYRKIKDSCVEEISTKFDNVFEMLTLRDTTDRSSCSKLAAVEIESLQKPILEFESMLGDLKKLSQVS
mgnify:CR=1 FL=1